MCICLIKNRSDCVKRELKTTQMGHHDVAEPGENQFVKFKSKQTLKIYIF